MTVTSEHKPLKTCDYSGKRIELERRADEVPHECSDPQCPGKQNKFQLDNYAGMLGTLRDSEKQFDALVETLVERTEQLAACRKELEKSTRLALGYVQQLETCRADRETTLNELGSALCAGDALRTLLQRTLNYMRETDSTRTPLEVIADLVTGLEGTTEHPELVPTYEDTVKRLRESEEERDRLRQACQVARECLLNDNPPDVPLLALKAALEPKPEISDGAGGEAKA